MIIKLKKTIFLLLFLRSRYLFFFRSIFINIFVNKTVGCR